MKSVRKEITRVLRVSRRAHLPGTVRKGLRNSPHGAPRRERAWSGLHPREGPLAGGKIGLERLQSLVAHEQELGFYFMCN